MQNSYSHVSPSPKIIQPQSLNQADNVALGNTITGFLLLLLPICLVSGAVLRKRYRTHRAAVLRRQIETLELMWRISPKH